MQNPGTSLLDSELKSGKVGLDSNGLPRPISGGFASVYKVDCATKTWAVRCFIKEFSDQQLRYEAISKQLAVTNFEFTTRFVFIHSGILVRGTWYPILKMEWVKGESLEKFVLANLSSPSKLVGLGQQIVDVARSLNKVGMAHGDLQHGNILIADGNVKLIDYDGMYVPELKGKGTHEAGHPNYQLLRDDTDFGPGLDNFSVWVIYLSLLALSVRPVLWTRFNGGDDCLLFRKSDFENPSQSLLLAELKRLPELSQLMLSFESLLALNPLDVPLIDPASPTVNLTKRADLNWLPSTPAKGAGIAFSIEVIWEKIGRISPPTQAYTRPVVKPPSGTAPWPMGLPTAYPLMPVAPENLLNPSWPGQIGLKPIPPRPTPPHILLSPPTWDGSKGLGPKPQKPTVPTVLSSPPKPPPIILPSTKIKRKTVLVGAGQKLLESLAVIDCCLLILLMITTGVFFTTSARNAFHVMLCVDGASLGLLTLAGTAWAMLEWQRRAEENRINAEYLAEVEQLREDAREKRKKWEGDLAKKQAVAKWQHEEKVRAWEAKVSQFEAENRKQEKVWQAESALKLEEARKVYEQNLRNWQILNDNYQAEENRQRVEWEHQLAETLSHKQQSYEGELARWHRTVASIDGEKARREKAELDARRELNNVEQKYKTDSSWYAARFKAKKDELVLLSDEYRRIVVQRETEVRQKQTRAREAQLRSHLAQHEIQDAAIPDIGAGRKRVLIAHGVKTASDVNSRRKIPGFGPALTSNLVEWRRNVEASFVFRTAIAITPAEMQELEARHEQRRQPLQQQLIVGEEEMLAISRDAAKHLAALFGQITSCVMRLLQAEADLAAVPGGI
jgi:hypothetical protein